MSCSRHILTVLLAVMVVAATATSAAAKPPTAEEVPSLQAIYDKAETEWKLELERAAAAKQDPLGDAIESYQNKLVPITDYQQLVEVILNSKDEKVETYRRQATDALVKRFKTEMEEDFEVRRVRREIGLKLLPLMKNSRDSLGLDLIEQVLYEWWRAKALDYGYRAEAKQPKRLRAYNKMKKFLEKDDS